LLNRILLQTNSETDVSTPVASSRQPDPAEEAQTELDEARNEIERLQSEIASLKKQASDPVPAAAKAAPPAEAKPNESETEESTNDGESAGERAARAQLGVLAGMMYQPLFAELGLPAETEEAARALIADSMLKLQGQTAAAIRSGSTTANELRAQNDAQEAALREQLSEVLNANELSAWDDYADSADQTLYEGLLDGQLTMLAPGLTEETRAMARVVLAEDLSASLDAFHETDSPYTLANFNAAQLEGLTEGLGRMPEDMEQEQYDLLAGFVDQVARTFETMGGE
jgi:hypothetical protein